MHEQYLEKSTMRGRKTFAFWTLVGLLFLLAIGNLVLTMTILGVLRLGQGMESLELVPEEYAIKFFGNADLDHVYKRDGLIEGFENEPIDIMSQNSSIFLNLLSRNGRPMEKISLRKNGSYFKNFDAFEVKNKEGKSIFSTTTPVFNLVHGTNNLNTKVIQTNRLVTHVRHTLCDHINNF